MSFRQARLDANKTQSEVAEHMGVDRVAVYQWESGITTPRASRLLRLAQFYGCTIDQLLKPDEKERQ
jgi:transcriptional regulator with XRE-family HTH domain